MATDIITGLRAKFFLNGNVVGFSTGADYNRSTATQAVEVLGSDYPVSIEILGRRVTVSVRMVFIRKGSFEALGFVPRPGAQNVINHPKLTVELYDQVSDEPIYTLSGGVCTSDNGSVDARGIMMGNATIEGTVIRDTIEQGK